MTVLAVNAGSSTLKFALYRVDNDPEGPALISGMVDGLATGGAMPLRWTANGETFKTLVQTQDKEPFACALHALQALLQDAAAADSLSAVAHRVVHGGGVYHQAVAVDATVLEALERFSPLAPLHQPHNVAGIRAFANAFPALPQIACFDTAFHATLPEVEYMFALPQAMSDQGVRRYGFHGLSYQYVLGCLGRLTPRATGRVIMAHLGSGASLCATNQGQSHATTMGFSALDGLMMGTRCGALDAGVLLHLLGEGWDRAQLEDLLYRRSVCVRRTHLEWLLISGDSVHDEDHAHHGERSSHQSPQAPVLQPGTQTPGYQGMRTTRCLHCCRGTQARH